MTSPHPDPRAAEVYHGYRDEHGTAHIDVLVPTTNAVGEPTGWQRLGEVPNRARDSATPMTWGYAGSGPAATARSLLLHAVADPRCPACAGSTRQVITDPVPRPYVPDTDYQLPADAVVPCGECDGEGVVRVPYQRFKFTEVSNWVEPEFWITRAAILAWLADNAPPEAPR